MRGRRHKLQVSTFPFLAVLLCAMGSLILILLVMDRKAHRAALNRARQQAAKLAEESARGETERERIRVRALAEQEKKRQDQHAKLTDQQIELQLQMRKVREQLREIAARLHYEQDTSTELKHKVKNDRDRLHEDEQLLLALRSRAQQSENRSKESNQTLHRMTVDLLRMEQALKDLKAAQQQERKTFSVVPYHGRRGENQRPIYVECGADGVVFHPERKAMSVYSPWSGSRGSPGGVRTEVERRIAKQRAKLANLPGNKEIKPYLLLLVRPAGVNNYYLFQRSLVGLDLKFGYEFIDDDWVLDFPTDDEMPNAQPWMTATKPSTIPPVSGTQTPSIEPIPHPVSTTLGGSPGSGSASGVRGLQSHLAGVGTENGQLGSSESPESQAGARGGTGVVQSGTARGGGGPGSYTPSGVAFSGTNGGFVGGTGNANRGGSQGGGGFVGNAADPSASRQSPSTQGAGENGLFPTFGPGGNASRESGPAGASLGRGYGRGHPSAMPPSQGGIGNGGEGEGEYGQPGLGSTTGGGGYRGMAPGIPGGTGAGSGYGSASSQAGTPTGVASGPFGGGVLGGQGAIGGGMPGSAGSGSGVPGSGVAGGGMPGSAGSGSGVPGSGVAGGGAPGMGVPGSRGFGGGTPGSGNSREGVPGNRVSDTGAPGDGSSNGGTTASGSPQGNNPSQFGSMGARGNNNGMGSGAPNSTGGGTVGSEGAAVLGSPVGGSGESSGNNQDGSFPDSPGMSGEPNGTNGTARQMQSTGGGSERVIYIDPLTGKQITPPPPASSQTPTQPPSEEPAGNRAPPRARIYHGTNNNSGEGEGETGGSQGDPMNGLAPPPPPRSTPRRPIVSQPAWIHGGRDWTIYLECRRETIVLYPSQQVFSLAEAIRPPSDNSLIKAIQKMIDRRQGGRRPGEPPYHPQLCLLVRAEHIRTFLSLYPALDALPIPKTRRNVDVDDDVIGIVIGSVP